MTLTAPVRCKVTTMTSEKIYCAEIVISVLKEDGKRHLETLVEAFPTKEKCIEFVDNYLSEVDNEKLKLAKLWEIVPVFEPVLYKKVKE